MSKRLIAAFVAALAAVFSASGPASAATVVYTLSGNAIGWFQDPLPTGPILRIPIGEYALKATSDTSAIELPGLAKVYRLTGARFLWAGRSNPIPLGAQSAFAIGEGVNAGYAAFGNFDGSGFSPSLLFGGGALAAYSGGSSLSAVPVTVSQFDPFAVSAGGHSIGIQITRFNNATFSAMVPEPASWGLMLIGIGGIGLVMRRSRPLAAA